MFALTEDRRYSSDLIFAVIDCCLTLVGVLGAICLRLYSNVNYFFMGEYLVLRVMLVVFLVQMGFYGFDLHNQSLFQERKKMLIRLLESLGVSFVSILTLYYLMPALVIGRGMLIISFILIALLSYFWRFHYARLFKFNAFREKVLIIGTGPFAKKVEEEIRDHGYDCFEIVGFIGEMEKRTEKECSSVIIGDCQQILSICKVEKVDRIIVALDERRSKLPLEQLLACRLKGITVDDGMVFTEDLGGKLSVQHLYPSALIFSNGFNKSLLYKKVKRFLDIFVSAVGLLLSFPFLLLIALAIKVDSKGPVLYRQERVGEDEKRFYLLKFRSMRVDAEENGPVWAGSKDERVTRVGRVIRRLRLDEWPQMANVLWSEMSLVGPRPERPFFIEQLRNEIPYYSQRHIIKPGITGWAQIRYQYGASKEDALEKLKYDLYYIKHMSFFYDLMIILETAKIVLLGKGAR